MQANYQHVPLFNGHYAKQPALVGIPSYERQNFTLTQCFIAHIVADQGENASVLVNGIIRTVSVLSKQREW